MHSPHLLSKRLYHPDLTIPRATGSAKLIHLQHLDVASPRWKRIRVSSKQVHVNSERSHANSKRNHVGFVRKLPSSEPKVIALRSSTHFVLLTPLSLNAAERYWLDVHCATSAHAIWFAPSRQAKSTNQASMPTIVSVRDNSRSRHSAMASIALRFCYAGAAGLAGVC